MENLTKAQQEKLADVHLKVVDTICKEMGITFTQYYESDMGKWVLGALQVLAEKHIPK